MSEQILLQVKFLGVEEFWLSPAGDDEDAGDLLPGRAQWISLLCEALPRALLAELGLGRILLGSSGRRRAVPSGTSRRSPWPGSGIPQRRGPRRGSSQQRPSAIAVGYHGESWRL